MKKKTVAPTILLKQERLELKREIKLLTKENKDLQKIVDIFNQSQDFTPAYVEHTIHDKSKLTEATAVVLASDWHVEQRVDPKRLSYHNVYNLEIARQRVQQFFQNVVKLLEKESQSTKIENLILHLGGDFISSNIHDALVAICQLGPAQAIIFAQELIIGGIEYLLEHTKVNITCPTSCGNHSRITKKIWISTEEDNSLETIIYHNIAKHFRDEKRFKLIMPTGPETIIDVYGKPIAFGHGHHGFRYHGGIGGIEIPLRKYLLRKYSRRKIYMLCIGHFHQFRQDSSFAINGSLIGYDDYCESMGFEFDVPRQTFFLIDKKRDSRTVTVPIMFDI